MNERDMEALRKAIEQAVQDAKEEIRRLATGGELQEITACIDSMELQMMGIKP